MSEKQDLAVLFSLLDRPDTEFVASESFQNLEKAPDAIRLIEPLGLPEVNRLICFSSAFETQEWAAKYSDAKRLYTSTEPFEVFGLLMQYNQLDEFREKILKYADTGILHRIMAYFSEILRARDSAKKERASLKAKITKEKKKQAESAEDVDDAKINDETVPEISENELQLEKLNQKIDEYEKFLKGFDGHKAAAEDALNRLADVAALDALREQAFRVIDANGPSTEEDLLIRYIRGEELTSEDESSLRDSRSLQKMLVLFEKDCYRDFAFPVIAGLCAEQALVPTAEPVREFIAAHGTMLAEYLSIRYADDPACMEDTIILAFIKYAIIGSVSVHGEYTVWWNSIQDASSWMIVLDAAEQTMEDPPAKTAAALLYHVRGAAMDTFMDLIQSEDGRHFEITPAELITELISLEVPAREALIRNYIRKTEREIRKLQRKTDIKERELNRRGQELFSSVYLPLEQLEELAVNLRLSDGDIACSLVAGHVITALASLREGLASLGLDAADDIEAWQKQTPVRYDPEKHRLSSVIGIAGETVKLQTLGYSYTDDDGERKVRTAEVYNIPAQKQEPMDKSAAPPKNSSYGHTNRKSYPSNKAHAKKTGYPKKKSYPHNGDISGRSGHTSRKGSRK